MYIKFFDIKNIIFSACSLHDFLPLFQMCNSFLVLFYLQGKNCTSSAANDGDFGVNHYTELLKRVHRT